LSGDSFERGGQPRSVPDSDGKAYDEMIRNHRQMLARRESAGQSLEERHQNGPTTDDSRGVVDAITAGIVHVLNEPREARRQVEHGHVVRGLFDGATAAADLEFGRSVVGGIRRGSFKLSGSHNWKQTRKWLGQKGLAEKGQHAHHALIPNGGWGKAVPDIVKNQPWNFKMTETPLHHIRIHGASRKFGLPQFNAVERYVHGTPRWWKAANGSAVGHGVQAIVDHLFGPPPADRAHHPAPKK
jgi:hypothetical protein